jgi:O-antigen/teichoic acid export membrane protein
VRRWLQRGRNAYAANRALLDSAISLISTTGVNAVLGFAFWWVATNHFAKASVGLASAMVSAMNFLAFAALLGLNTLLMAKVNQMRDQRAALITTSLLFTGGLATLFGFVFGLLAPQTSGEFAPLATSPLGLVVFAVGIGLTAAGIVLDSVLVGMQLGNLQVIRNVVFSVVKLLAIFLMGQWDIGDSGPNIYAAWIAGLAVSFGAFALLIWRKGMRPASDWRPRFALLRDLRGEALQHHLLNMILQAVGLFLPVIVTALLSAEINAVFAVAWLLCGFVFTVPYMVSVSLYAVGSADRTGVGHKVWVSVRLSLFVSLAACALFWVAGDYIVAIFGSGYTNEAPWALRVLALGAFPIIIKDNYFALQRIEGQLRKTIVMAAIGTTLELSGAVLGGLTGGLQGLCLGWLIGISVEALLMSAPIVQVIRTRHNAPSASSAAVAGA